jgi:putative transposase
MQLLIYKYRLYPTPAQAKALYGTLRICRHWYNMCLSERQLAWEHEHRKVTKSEQEQTAIKYRKAFRCEDRVFSQTLQTVCDDLDKAFKAFFRRTKAGETPGYPRFKGSNRFRSFAFKQFGRGAWLDGRRLKLFGIGRVRVRWHRPLVGKVKQVRILHSAGRWFTCFIVEQPDPTPLPPTGCQVGLDFGVKKLLTASNGEEIDNPKWYRHSESKLRVAQRSLSRKKKGSKNRKKALRAVQRLHEHVANTRHDFLNKLVHDLIARYDLIALENLRIANMVRNPHLAKSILDAGWGYFRQHLTNKAVNAGRQIVFVNPAYTSRTCSCCGALFPNFDLSVRWVECTCGLSLDRDHNAAINILKRAGQDVSVSANVVAPEHALLRNPRL